MNQIGIPGSMGRLAEGEAFFDREEVIARAWDLLKTSNLLLLAPRRVGKSSLLEQDEGGWAGKGLQDASSLFLTPRTSWTSSSG
jgi:hypothetical protein